MSRCEAYDRDASDRTKLGELKQCENPARYLVEPGPLGLCAVHRVRGTKIVARLDGPEGKE